MPKDAKGTYGSEDSPAFTVKGILFHVDEEVPRMVDVPCAMYIDDEDGDEILQHSPLLRSGKLKWFDSDTFVRSLDVQTDGPRGPSLGRTLEVQHDEAGLVKGLKTNRCIARATNGQARYPWAGNFIVMRAEEPRSYYARYYDAVMAEDLVPVLKYFISYNS
jgi:hypothetical protein